MITPPSIHELMDSLIIQNFVPRTIVFSNSEHGQVETQINQVTGNYPTVWFRATLWKDGCPIENSATMHDTLRSALHAIGLKE